MQEAPLPVYESERLVGIELEYDSGSMSFRSPEPLPRNWVSKFDGSLRNGREFVLEPAVQYNSLMPHIQTFSDAFDPIKIGLTSRGGFHVHVQSHDYTLDDAYNLAGLYTHFQPVINQLLAKSRVDNRFCQAFDSAMTKEQLIEEFRLNESATNRESAKYSRTYRVINFAMMRCQNVEHRSVEFRQGSPSKRFSNIYGWTTFVTTLTDIARDSAAMTLARACPQTLDGLIELLKQWEYARCGHNISEWVKWRHEIMNAEPTDEMVNRAVEFLRDRPQGLFSIATGLDVNYPTAKRILAEAINRGLICLEDQQYRLLAIPHEMALADLQLLREAAQMFTR